MRHIIDRYAALPFEYGVDCCQFAAEVVEHYTGNNPMQELTYSTESEALDLIDSYGGLYDAVCHFLGDPYDGHKTGDVCLLDANNGNEAVGVIYRDRVVARVQSGLMDYPLARAKAIWCTNA